MNIAIKNGRIIDPYNKIDKVTDLLIENGKIVSIGQIPLEFSVDKTIHANNRWVIPGIVDICCRPQMQHPHGTTLQQEAQAAVKRGITSLCVPPDGDPIIDTPANVSRLQQQGSTELPSLYAIGALTHQLKGESIADLSSLKEAGCVAFSNAQNHIKDLQFLRQCYDYAASFDLLIVIQPQDAFLAKGGVAHEGIVSTRLGFPGIPDTAESVAIAHHLLLIEQSGARAHFTCLSSATGLSLIAKAKANGLKVTADCAIHMLHLTEMDLLNFDANCHLYPPLRGLQDQEALIRGVNENILDAIVSDHRPLDSIAKLAPFADTIPGLSSIDTYLSLCLHHIHDQKLDLPSCISAMTYKPAQIFNIPAGTLSVGANADICIVDPDKIWVVEDNSLLSHGKNTPFKRWELPGCVTHTFIKGNLVHELE